MIKKIKFEIILDVDTDKIKTDIINEIFDLLSLKINTDGIYCQEASAEILAEVN